MYKIVRENNEFIVFFNEIKTVRFLSQEEAVLYAHTKSRQTSDR